MDLSVLEPRTVLGRSPLCRLDATSSAVDLKFLSDVRRARHGTAESKNRTRIICVLVYLCWRMSLIGEPGPLRRDMR